ncbi:MAG: hypothetical protein ACM3XR_10580 [Bacillota bacterium]
MNIDQIISMISSIGTFIATIIVFFTLLEMRKQRKNSMSPELAFSRKRFYTYYVPYNDLLWVDKKLTGKKLDNIGNNYHNSFSIETNNIGMGTAKDIDIKWEFDIKNLIDRINKLDKNKIYEIKYIENKDSYNKRLIIKYCNRLLFYDMENDLNDYHEYILSSQIKNETFSIYFPECFIKLISFLLYLFIDNDFKEINEIIHDFPKIKMQMNYYDIGGTKYQKNYLLKFNFYSFAKKQEESNLFKPAVDGFIEFVKIN